MISRRPRKTRMRRPGSDDPNSLGTNCAFGGVCNANDNRSQLIDWLSQRTEGAGDAT